MTDHSDLIERARAYRPYNHLNDGDLVRQLLDALSSQSLSLSEAREEIERLRETIRQHGVWDFPRDIQNLTNKLEAAEDALRPFAREAGDWGEHVPDDVHPLIAAPSDSGTGRALFTIGDLRRAQSALENSKPVLANATYDPADPSLSSLRKGAEVAPLEWHRVTYGWLAFEEWYRIEDNGPNWTTDRYWLYERGERLGKYGSLEDAQAAMQTRHETRIRSALVSGSREDGA